MYCDQNEYWLTRSYRPPAHPPQANLSDKLSFQQTNSRFRILQDISAKLAGFYDAFIKAISLFPVLQFLSLYSEQSEFVLLFFIVRNGSWCLLINKKKLNTEGVKSNTQPAACFVQRRFEKESFHAMCRIITF